jgi:hypothetical protein
MTQQQVFGYLGFSTNGVSGSGSCAHTVCCVCVCGKEGEMVWVSKPGGVGFPYAFVAGIGPYMYIVQVPACEGVGFVLVVCARA